jgi:acetyl-CoA acetyltransferase family protein
MKTERLVVVAGVRTPFARMGSDLAGVAADELGRTAVNSLLIRTGIDPRLIDEVIIGCVVQPVEASNVARVIALRAGVPEPVPAVTVNRNCASGFEALTQAHDRMRAGRGSIFVVGGVESMSQAPLLFPATAAKKFTALSRSKSLGQKLKALAAFRPADFKPRPSLLLGLTDPVCGLNMGETAEALAREFHVSREQQDELALMSHQRALSARSKLAEEITPVFIGGRTFSEDNGPRTGQTLEALAKLRPVFDRQTGTVTAGNSSQITDGAVALLVMTEGRASELGLVPLGAVIEHAHAGCEPARMGLGPAFAMAELERRCGLKLADADLVEINEAFAAQVEAVLHAVESEKFARKWLGRERALGEIPREKLNVNGGAIALGHPVGATGARLVLTSLLELRRRGGGRALVAACVGGGQGTALWLETL